MSGTICLKAWFKITSHRQELAVIDLPAKELDNMRIRRIAFIVITLVFIISVAAMIYWSVNVAAARISSRLTANLQAPNPLKHGPLYEATHPFTIPQLERNFTA
jgi:hypothetical protein